METLQKEYDSNGLKTKLFQDLNENITQTRSNKKVPGVTSMAGMQVLAAKLKEKVMGKIESDRTLKEPKFSKSLISTFIQSKHMNAQQKLVKKQTMFLTGELMKKQQHHSPTN